MRKTLSPKIMISASLLIFSILIFSSCSEPDIPQGYALIYGVTEFTDLADLAYTDDDAEDLATLLESKDWIITLGLNEDADMESVKTDVDNLAATMDENDRFIFYYSGHGGPFNLDGGEPSTASNDYDEIIVLHNSSSTLRAFVNGTADADDVLNVTFSDDSLGDLLSKLPTNNKTIIIDACNSGGFVNSAFTYNAIPSDYELDQTTTVYTPSETFQMYLNYSISDSDMPYSEYTFLSASGEAENSTEYDGSISHGLFTYFFLQSGEADYNSDGYVTLIEAWKFTTAEIEDFYKLYNIDTGNQHIPNVGAFPVDPVLFEAD